MIEGNRKVNIKNETYGRVIIDVPDMLLKRTWERQGVIRQIPFEDLEQAYYDPGVEYMFKQGILSIDDMEVKIALGLEPEEAMEPVNVIILTDDQRKRYLTVMPLHDFKAAVDKLSYEQVHTLVDYAIANELAALDKCDYLKEKTGIDIYKAIQLNKADKED